MAVHNKLVAFDRPLVSATIPGRSTRLYTESEMAAIRTQAYQEGADAARAFANQQLVEFRAEVQALQEGLFQRLSTIDADITAQLRDALPLLAVEISRRLLADYEPPAEQVLHLCEETLRQLYPEHENLELVISPRDAAMLESLPGEWKNRYPGLRITIDATLETGDCQVRSRFGLTDARRQSKLEALSRELLSA
jgi:Flagellar biosynthesis/type III secretory pathway protein